MNKYDWKNAFPKPSENFHNKLCMTLESFEKENVKMKKVSFKKSIIIAAAVLAVGTVAFASKGAVNYVMGSTSSKPDYTNIPATETLNKNVGFSPKIVEQFSNGYTFKGGHNGKNKYVDEENGTEEKYKSFMADYEKDGDKVMLSADTYADSHKDRGNSEVSDYNGIAIAYISYVNKVVPADYQQTEQDMKDEESGKYVFSYGAEKVEISQVQGVEWEQDGIYYNITAIDSPLDKQGLINMAKEVIDN